MKIAADAKLDDGLFDIVNIGDITTARLLRHAHALYRGTLENLDEVKVTRARKIEISSVEPAREIHIETDGELPGKLPAVYEVVPNALRVRMPKKN
jgi:diacylglycerol kinase family enzyme